MNTTLYPNPISVRSGGFTVMELLAVMSIVAVLVGMSIASLMRVGEGPALEIAEREVRSTLARVRSASRQQSALGEVVVLPDDGDGKPALRVLITFDAGSWHFDEEGGRQLGGRNNFAKLAGAKVVGGGTVRSCAEFDGGDRIVCASVPVYEPMQGFDISLDVRPERDSEGGGLCSFGEAFTLELTEDGGLIGTVMVKDGSKPTVAKTAPGLVAPEAWARIRMAYDGLEVKLWAHGVLEAMKSIRGENQEPRSRPKSLVTPEPEHRLTIGAKGFVGRIDEVVYRTVTEEEVLVLARGAGGLQIPLQSPVRVRFDADGRLDPRVHEGEVVIPFGNEDGERREIRIDMTGVIR